MPRLNHPFRKPVPFDTITMRRQWVERKIIKMPTDWLESGTVTSGSIFIILQTDYKEN